MKGISIFLAISSLLISGILIFESLDQKVEAELDEFSISKNFEAKLLTIQGNSLLPISNPSSPEPPKTQPQKIRVVVTAYSSTIDQTDSDPFITAAGTLVREGIVATNILPFGTKIKLPEFFGDRIFVVEDRMSWKKGYHIDIWFPNREDALEFGAKITEVLILSS